MGYLEKNKMAIFKCKMCGGSLDINNNETVATCEYCGTQQTLPKLDDDRKANLYDRANHFRRNNEFDKAMSIYEQILNEDNTDAETYWSLVLCRYGIEYVEDPTSRKRIPTVNRAQFTSIFDDEDYKSALQYADEHQKEVYEKEADIINEIQKGILAISQKEEPFDVFICYKETDNNGRRTLDSVLATELYHELKREGFKVFFSRITLEDKLGIAYEPYIFAALNSAKVMVVLGTKPEYFNAVWVKNEWSRYLALIKNGARKMLIPAYKDMDPYDLPEEFSHLQAQDMSKLGFMQDLIRGIKKIVEADAPKATFVKENVIIGGNVSSAPLLRRAFIFLEDGDWNSADEYCEKVLDIDPENAQAYLGKLMAELHVKKQDELKDCSQPFDERNNYQKAVRFADDSLKSVIMGYIEHIIARNENRRLAGMYNRAKGLMSAAHTENTYKEAGNFFKTISNYLDSAELAEECYNKAEEIKKDEILSKGNKVMTGTNISNYEYAIKQFESISGWRDADEKILLCKKRIEEIKAEEEERRLERERIRKRDKTVSIVLFSLVILVVAFVIIWNKVIIPNGKYNDAIELMNDGKYEEAYSVFRELDGFRDSNEKADEIRLTTQTKEMIKNINVGDCFKFGIYEQDNNTSNGREDVEWIVLEKKESQILVISKYVLDCKPYNTGYTEVTWEKCTLREWLNNDFFDSTFFAKQKEMISSGSVPADKNPDYSTNPGKATQDQVFLLSINEANKYFSSNSARQCKPTDYAIENGVLENGSGNCWWWLRSSGYLQFYAAGVDYTGDVVEYGTRVNYGNYAVRPAMWIDLSKNN